MTAAQVLRPAPYGPSISLPAPYPEGTAFPLSLSPARAGVSLDDITAEIRGLAASGRISSLLDRHGAVYFQGLGLKNAHEFSKFAHAFGWLPHEDIGNPVRRTVLAKNVATANEGPNTQPVYPHNEFGLSPHYPAYGVKYQLFHPNGPKDQTTSAGTTVLQAYGRHVLDSDDAETTRQKIEKEIRRLPTATWRWENQSATNPLGDLRVWQVLPVARDHPRTRQRAFFNNIVSRFLNADNAGTLLPPHLTGDGKYQPPAFYGDDSLIPREYLDSAVEFINETRAMVTWQAGDVILIDNHHVQHAREPWTG
ncbi:hypothetical protein B0T26DRAFT_739253 [Lasiosphaeria miniovina]|uniref:TauD/TfdA-like domain-containing protein n=1 Tax=Lasiosphaeria miniovina TaxID=1954250 RepID=A0AA40ATR5_9PEZI|nr:uncharacterized protein B0T26DRAFT_739253 [Lasiosphaeria miniovina]KAK0721861.1 hypothetical protein B0T26DRAFT_739253 [Lasiosphaeria miniovina]